MPKPEARYAQTKLDKYTWLARYEAEIRRRLKGCKKQPDWQHLPAGHMRFAQGITPELAASLYLRETTFGKQQGVRA
jgi:hypothetical protein